MTPARISGVSMFPPCASGTSEDRASNAAGRHPPCRASDRGAGWRCDRLRSRGRPPCARPGPPRRSRPARGAGRAERRPSRGRERPEQRHRAGGGPVAGRLDRDEVDRQGVARLGSLHEERSGLRIHEGELDHARDVIVRPADLATERVLRPELEDVSRPDRPDRRDAAEGPRELRGLRTVREHVHRASIRRSRLPMLRQRAISWSGLPTFDFVARTTASAASVNATAAGSPDPRRRSARPRPHRRGARVRAAPAP